MYFITHGKKIYIGITYDFDKRDHSKDRKPVAELRVAGVYKQVTDYLPAMEAARLEKRVIKKFRSMPEWEVINVRDGGELSHATSQATV